MVPAAHCVSNRTKLSGALECTVIFINVRGRVQVEVMGVVQLPRLSTPKP